MNAGALAIILARAGSRGVPGKNVIDIAGRPCIAWTIDHALGARSISSVLVSSDDANALRIAEEMGCATVSRPADLASDTARVDAAARHALLEAETDPAMLGRAGRIERDVRPVWTGPIVVLYANVPVRPPGLIDRAVELLLSAGCDSVQSYQEVGKNHPWWTARLDQGGRVSPWEGDVLNHGVFRRQDLPPAYVPDGAVIALSRAALMLEIPGVAAGPHAFFGKDRRGVISPEGSVVDIDAPIDAVVARAILQNGTDEKRAVNGG
ncbi:MAG TPA: acylneuraminate cytidylyltransferase family protein [Phycisphaerales bacterium]|nr:acylneuraminate cytidylyltransferase family protein [Phycisphaerales bacterium]